MFGVTRKDLGKLLLMVLIQQKYGYCILKMSNNDYLDGDIKVVKLTADGTPVDEVIGDNGPLWIRVEEHRLKHQPITTYRCSDAAKIIGKIQEQFRSGITTYAVENNLPQDLSRATIDNKEHCSSGKSKKDSNVNDKENDISTTDSTSNVNTDILICRKRKALEATATEGQKKQAMQVNAKKGLNGEENY